MPNRRLETSLHESKQEDMKDLAVAVVQVLKKKQTKAITRILRQESHADYIFSSVRNQDPVYDLLKLAKAETGDFSYRIPYHVNRRDSLGNILLHCAIRISAYHLTKMLLQKGAKVTSVDMYLSTPLHIACCRKSLKIAKLLVEKSPTYILEKTDLAGWTPLDLACRFSTPEIVQLLLSKGCSVLVSPEKTIRTTWHQRLEGSLLNAVCNTPKRAAIIASMVLDAGANIDHKSAATGTTALMIIINMCAVQKRRARYLAKIIESPYLDLFMLLIQRGHNVNATDNYGVTALCLAAELDQEVFIRKLIISGSDVNKCNNFGYTPLAYACENENRTIVDLLLKAGAKLSTSDVEMYLPEFYDEDHIQLFNYIINISKQCLSLEDLCIIAVRENLQNAEDAFQLRLPEILIDRLLLEH